MAADEAGTAVEQRAFAGPQAGKGFTCRAGHIAAVEVVYFIVPHPLAVHIVVEAGVVLGGVHQAQRTAHHLAKELVLHDVVLPAQLVHAGKESLEPLRRVKQRRFVHIVPETLDAAVGQRFVLHTEPLPHLRAQKICKVGFAGPHRRHKGGAVLFFAEVALCKALGTDGAFRVDAHARIDDGHQPDALRFHLCTQGGKVREALPVHRKIGVVLHVIDVHADHIQRQIVLFVLAGHLAHILGGLVAKAALCQTKGPLGREIAAADQLPELAADVVQVVAGNEVKLIVRLFRGKAQDGVFGVADIVTHLAREIDEHAEAPAGWAVVDQQKIVRTIVGKLILAVVGFIGVVGDVVPAALVDAAGHLAQTVHDGIRGHPVGPAALFGGEEGHRPGGNGDLLHHALGGQGQAKTETLDHRGPPCIGIFSVSFLYLTPGRFAKQETKPALFCHKTGRMRPKHKNIGGRRRMRLQIPAHTVILEPLL